MTADGGIPGCLHATDQRLQGQIEALSQKYDALVTQIAGRTHVESGAHFATGDATLSEQDKSLLDDFARAIRSSHSDALITVEGFTDPAGSTAFNRRLVNVARKRSATTW